MAKAAFTSALMEFPTIKRHSLTNMSPALICQAIPGVNVDS